MGSQPPAGGIFLPCCFALLHGISTNPAAPLLILVCVHRDCTSHTTRTPQLGGRDSSLPAITTCIMTMERSQESYRRSWAKDSSLFRKSGIIQEEGTGNKVAYFHRNLHESVHLVAYKDKVTGSVWSLSLFPRSPNQHGPASSATQTPAGDGVPLTASNTWQHRGSVWGSQPPTGGMFSPIPLHCSRGGAGSRARKGARR